jgi:VanZ family protein
MKGNKQALFRISLVFVFLGITILSLLPPKSGVELGEHDKINHFIAYSVLSLNFGIVVANFRKHLIGVPLLIAYGLLMEFMQGFVPGREPSLLDALANSGGVILGFVFLSFLTMIKKYNNNNI